MNTQDYFFRNRLAIRQEKHRTLLCVGLDPDIKFLPECLKTTEFHWGNQWTCEIVANWMIKIVEATAPFASMYKPQKAHWEALGPYGQIALAKVVNWIKTNHPDIPVFLDCKRGDIDNTQEMYRTAHFTHDGVDGMNFNPYMGKGCMKYLIDKDFIGRAIVGLCYTSNPEAREVQDVLLQNGKPYWQFIAEKVLRWSQEFGVSENAGLVMAAAYENPKGSGEIYNRHLVECREIVGNELWFLIPGIGKQGGALEETIDGAYTGPGSISINESRSVDFASTGEDFMQAAAGAAETSRDSMRSFM